MCPEPARRANSPGGGAEHARALEHVHTVLGGARLRPAADRLDLGRQLSQNLAEDFTGLKDGVRWVQRHLGKPKTMVCPMLCRQAFDVKLGSARLLRRV